MRWVPVGGGSFESKECSYDSFNSLPSTNGLCSVVCLWLHFVNLFALQWVKITQTHRLSPDFYEDT